MWYYFFQSNWAFWFFPFYILQCVWGSVVQPNWTQRDTLAQKVVFYPRWPCSTVMALKASVGWLLPEQPRPLMACGGKTGR